MPLKNLHESDNSIIFIIFFTYCLRIVSTCLIIKTSVAHLQVSLVDDSFVAARVLVTEASLEHVGDGLYSAVGVFREARGVAHRKLVQQQERVEAAELWRRR